MANGAGWSVSYTVGQIAYSTINGTNGSLIQGMQQPYEISFITSITDIADEFKIQVFPNPATDLVVINLGTQELKHLRFVILDLQGKILKSEKIVSITATLDFSKWTNGTYFLRILSDKKQVKTIQIIKNK